MTVKIGGLFELKDRVQMEALNQRLARTKVITGNISNSETPGYRSIGYDFEDQLQSIANTDNDMLMKSTHPKHYRSDHALSDGTVLPDVYIRPSESVSHDGNTVDVDKEMASLAENQLLYRSTVELINRKVGILRYAITSGGRG